MLNLNICKKCCDEVADNRGWAWKSFDMKSVSRRGKVWCDIVRDTEPSNPVDIRGQPPMWCPYKLEHGVSEAMSNA
jgi:hypothetical protein